MLKYAKIINEETKQCEVGIGTNEIFYQSLGMDKMEVEQAWDSSWYVLGFAPEKSQEFIKIEAQRQLDSTDYKIIKAIEYQLAGLENPYNLNELHAEREVLREVIRGLENEQNQE